MSIVSGAGDRRVFLRFMHAATAVIALAFSPFPLADTLDEPATFDIPALSVRTALIAFSKQGDVQVMGNGAALARAQSTAVKGTMSKADALRQLLRNTGLDYEWRGKAIIVKAVAAAPTAPAAARPTLRVF